MAIISGSATNGNDRIVADGANDLINSLAGNDTVYGRGGNDTLIGGEGDDTLSGGAGNDLVIGAKGNDRMIGNKGNDILAWADGDGSDRISGKADTDIVAVQGSLAQGDSFVLAQQGNLAIFDRVNLGLFTLTVDTSEQFVVQGEGGNDRLDVNNLANTDVNLVTFAGGAGNDTLDGSDTSTALVGNGNAGNDLLIGSSANDTLIGGAGNDLLIGGAGADRFRFDAPNEGIDLIADFAAVDDSIRVSADGFGGGLNAGSTLSAAQFRLGSTAGDANDRFIYNDANGALFYDGDGAGAGAQVRLATLIGAPTISNANIVVV